MAKASPSVRPNSRNLVRLQGMALRPALFYRLGNPLEFLASRATAQPAHRSFSAYVAGGADIGAHSAVETFQFMRAFRCAPSE